MTNPLPNICVSQTPLRFAGYAGRYVSKMNDLKKGFPPIADVRATVLILGTMPGEQSLRQNEYYANARNSFWRIMATLFEFDYDASYEKRTSILRDNKVALWDVMGACERRGSLDSAIKSEAVVENDFMPFYSRHPRIRSVFFNGAKAEREYSKRVLPKLSGETKCIEYFRLPSSSPTMARLSFEEKLLEWTKIVKKT